MVGQHVTQVACGSTYCAAVTSYGELYTWGRGNYGRLGHGNCDDVSVPTVVAALKSHRIVDAACGCGEGQTIAVTDTGIVYNLILTECSYRK